ncbi:MAG: TatD family hydrolase, partial [Candidatus Nanohaloarchaea archaeon]|nr:TatD family hydrolase [Candidatus Nanohaloarchaea archaeon]
MNLIDTHCHLDFDQYDDDREDVIQKCAERMAAVINSGTNVERNRASLDLARNHDVIEATLGVHPTYVKEELDLDRIAEQIREHQRDILGVGEIGLDYHHVSDRRWREEQEEIFERFLAVAEELQLPAVLHTRDAEKQALDIVDGYDFPAVVLHCFNGAPTLAEQAVDRGYYVSISTQVLYSERVQALAETVPLEHILLETDAPFLYQGERNVPWNVGESAEKIADIKDADVEEVGEVTTRNARDALDF